MASHGVARLKLPRKIRRPRPEICEPLPFDPRDPEVLRAKEVDRARTPKA